MKSIPIQEKVCVDEQIIPFKRKHSLEVYMQKNPKKWGCKTFALCDSSGVVLNFDLYTGKIDDHSELPDVGIRQPLRKYNICSTVQIGPNDEPIVRRCIM
jgi:hypothetical protein